MTWNAGDAVAGYQIEARIGAGGMATVYQAYHARLDRHVAIKILHDTFVHDDSFLERFEREARIVARLEHPSIVPIYDYAEFDGQPYFVMKYIEGGTLKRRLIKQGISLDEITRMMTMLADALTYAHEKGVLHRDIKPSNILIDERDLPYLTDFGLARILQVGDSTISHDMMLGTPFYLSPEQAKGERDLTPATDVYSFAVILYELLAGRVPFIADSPYAIVHEHIYTTPAPPSQLNPDLDAGIDDVLLKALAKSAAQRYQSASALMEDLNLALAQSGLSQLPPRRPVSEKPPPDAGGDFVGFNWNDMGNWIDQSMRKGANAVSQIAEQFDIGKKKKAPGPTVEELIRRRVHKKLKARSELIQHLTVYLAVNAVLWSIWLFGRGGFPWPLFVAVFWGIGMVNHYVDFHYKHGRGADSGEEEVASEITRQAKRSQRYQDDSRGFVYDQDDEGFDGRKVRLNDDGELTDSFLGEFEDDRRNNDENETRS